MKISVRKFLIAAAVSAVTLSPPSTATAQTGFGQSFRVPDSPFTILTNISATGLSGSAPAGNDFLAQIYAFAGTSIVGPAVWSASLSSGFSSGFFAGPYVNLTAGGSYLLIVKAPLTYDEQSMSTVPSIYADGSAQACTFGVCSAYDNGWDVEGFSLTFASMPITVTPEPGTWMLSGVGLLAVGAVSRRRKKRSV